VGGGGGGEGGGGGGGLKGGVPPRDLFRAWEAVGVGKEAAWPG